MNKEQLMFDLIGRQAFELDLLRKQYVQVQQELQTLKKAVADKATEEAKKPDIKKGRSKK